MRNSTLLILLFFGFATNIHAQTLTNEAEGYSLTFPGDWAVTKEGPIFAAQHHDGSSLDATKASLPENIKSVKVAALMARASALAAGLCGPKASEFELSGKDWAGNGFHCNNRPSQEKPKSEIIGFTVKRGSSFYQFSLFVPRQDWETNKQQYQSLFKSLRFHP